MTVQKIKLTVAEHFGITVQDIDGPRRQSHITWPRQVAMTVVRNLTRRSHKATADEFNRTGSNILHACRSVRGRVETDPQELRNYIQIIQKLKSRSPDHGDSTKQLL